MEIIEKTISTGHYDNGKTYTDRLSMALPDNLKGLKQYLLWRREPSKDAGKKDLKVPYYAKGVRRFGTQGSPEDRAGLVSFAEVLRVYESSNGRYAGIGIAMLPEA
jgi:primase-polymerase (primpol)-like protein